MKIETYGNNTEIEHETLMDGSVIHNVVFREKPKEKAPRVNLRFGCTSEKAAMDLADHIEAAAWIEAFSFEPTKGLVRATRRVFQVLVTKYELDDFPESTRYDEYVGDRLAELYPGASFDVEYGPSVRCSALFEHAKDVENLIKVDLWDSFCSHDFKNYPVRINRSTRSRHPNR